MTFDRIDSDGCMSTNDTVLLLASGASGLRATESQLSDAVTGVCQQLSRALIADAEGPRDICINVVHAASESDAVEVARAVSRSNLLKCAIHGRIQTGVASSRLRAQRQRRFRLTKSRWLSMVCGCAEMVLLAKTEHSSI